MKTALALLVVAATAVSPARAAEHTLILTDFNRMQVDGNYIVEVTAGRGTSGRISGSSAAIDATDVQVQGRTLIIRRNRANWSGTTSSQTVATVRLTVPALQNAWARGPAIVRIDRMAGMRIGVSLEGSGSLTVGAIKADRLDIGLLGSGQMTLGGTVGNMIATVRGSSALDASALSVADARLVSETAGNVSVLVRRAADVSATGSGNVTILGKPACTVKAIGSGTVSCGSDQPQ